MYQPSWILCGKLSVVGRTFNKVILLIRKKSLCYLRHPFQLLGKATCVKSPPNFLENASRTAFADFTWLRKNICKQHASCMLCSTMIISKPHPSCFFAIHFPQIRAFAVLLLCFGSSQSLHSQVVCGYSGNTAIKTLYMCIYM